MWCASAPRWREGAEARRVLMLVRAQDTDRFCRNVLSHPSVSAFIREHFLAWAGSVTQQDAHQLATLLRVATFPFVGIVTRTGNRSTRRASQVRRLLCC